MSTKKKRVLPLITLHFLQGAFAGRLGLPSSLAGGYIKHYNDTKRYGGGRGTLRATLPAHAEPLQVTSSSNGVDPGCASSW